MSRIALLATLLTLCAPRGVDAETFKPGDSVLVRHKGLLTIGTVVAKSGSDRSVVAMTSDSRDLTTVADIDLKPYRSKRSAKTIRGWSGVGPGLYRIDTAAHGTHMVAALHSGRIQVFRQDILLPLTEIARKERTDGVAISPDGTLIAACDSAGTLSIYSTTNGKLLRTANVGKGCRYLTFATSGMVAFEVSSGTMALRLYDTNTGKLSPRQMRIRKPWQRRSALRFSLDGKWLIDGRDTSKPFRGERGVRVYAVAGMRLQLKRILRGPEDAASIAISRDGNVVVAAGRESQLMAWKRDTGRLLWTAHAPTPSAKLDLAPDGSSIAVCGTKRLSNPVQLHAMSDGKFTVKLGELPTVCGSIRFSGTGDTVYAARHTFSNALEMAVYRFRPTPPSTRR